MDSPTLGFDSPEVFGGIDLETGKYGESAEELAVKQALKEIAEKNPLTGSRIALARMCISLAQNIAKGNAKGRAVANEVATLGSLMEQLDPAAPDVDDSDLPPELRKIADALAATPRPGGPTASNPTEP